MTDFFYSVDADGVATITWDTRGKTMNVMNEQGFVDLNALVDTALADEEVRGIVIASGKKGSFAGGMDLNVIARMREDAGGDPARGLFDGVMNIHGILRKIERAGMDDRNRGGKPIVAALPGTALGIGLEIPLACHRIIAADNPRARIGLPEIMVGIFPGAGGTTRMVRKMGLIAAAPFLFEGKSLDPQKATASGLIDEVVPPERLLSRAREWVLSEPEIVKPWDRKGYRIPGGAPYHPQGFMTFTGASAMVGGRTKGVYPAARALLSAIYEGATTSFETALRIEARWFVNVLMNPSSSAMIRSLFINKRALEKGANGPDSPDDRPRKVGVLGAGMMGAGIALVSARSGMEVVLIDTTLEAVERGKAHAESYLDKGIARRKTTPDQKAEVLGRIETATDFAALKDCDLIVEAVFEDPEVKAKVTKAAAAVVSENCIIATNTSTLPISDLARACRRPERFIGIHFFSPVEKMMLVEIIKGRETGAATVAGALGYTRGIGKTPIVVNDARFFYANRCIIPYINEGIGMVKEGVAPALIENAARMLGMPLGPLQLTDETSIDLGVKIARATKAAMGDSYPNNRVDEVLFWMATEGRLGRKARAGFYAYDEKGKRLGLWRGVGAKFPQAGEQPDIREVQNRMTMIQVLEAVRALEEGVLEDIREGDVGAILGWGFMPWSGGPFGYLDIVGAVEAADICDDLAARHGQRFAVPDLLREMARSGERFYDRFVGATGKDGKAA